MDPPLGKGKAEDLLGLQAQLILNSPSIGPLLSFSGGQDEIDLREVLRLESDRLFPAGYFEQPRYGSAPGSHGRRRREEPGLGV